MMMERQVGTGPHPHPTTHDSMLDWAVGWG